MQVSEFMKLLRQLQNFVLVLTRQGTSAAPAVPRPVPKAAIPPRRVSKDDQHFATKEDWFVQNWRVFIQAWEILLNSIFCPLIFKSMDQTGPGEESSRWTDFLTLLFQLIRKRRVVQPRSKDNSIGEGL